QLCLAQLLHHEHAPLALAQRCSPLDTSTPLLNALLNYRYAGGSAVLDDDLPQHDLLQAVQQLGGQERTHYPLVVSVNDEQASGGFSLDLQCVQQIGTERIAAMLLQTLHVLVQALKHAPQTALHALDLLSENERAELQHFNATTVNLAASGYLHRQIEAQAQRTPQAIALVDDALALSYADLDTRANQLAHHLIALGVGPDVRVAVCLPRGVDLVVALLAVLKAGGAYVPLDPVYPRARLDFMLQDSAARCLLTHTALADLLPGNQFARVCMDDTASWAMHPAHTPATQDVGPHHLAYVIYTSGSSGHPKGVMISHHALTQFLAALHTQVPLSPEDRLLAVTTVCFDIAGLELFAPLVHGARVVIAGDQAIQDPAYWSQLLDRHAISVLQATPAFWQMLLDAGWQSRPGLRLLCGGEALRQDLAQGLRAGGGQLCNLYGPTEATIWASLHPVPGDDTGNVVPLGRPLANTQLWVLDASHQLVPLGVAGELYIAGPQLARGYLGRPDLTAERFVPDPFAKHPGERMYKTGDLARWRADGVLESLGRNDAQVKIRGVRIELGEIETALRGCAGVREATVLLRQDIPGEPRLVAYLVTEQPEHADPLALRDALAAGLSEVMLPTAYVRLDALPLSANGKLDRRALPAPDATAIVRGDCLPPANAIERSLAKLWASVLGLQRIGRDDHFFELGGHSLSAMRLMTAANRLGLPLTLNLVYAHPTLRMQADSLLGGAHRWGTRALAARRQGTRPPLFVVPTGIGDIAYAFELAAHLDADIPVYALPWPDPLPATLEALAAQMVELIQAVQPQGPYHLLGYSSGGLLAYAIAQHFGLHDQPIAFLGLLDCDCPDRAPDPVPLQEATKRRLLERVETMLEHGAYRDDAIHAACRDLLAKAEQASLQELAEHAAEDTVLNALAAQEQTSLAEVIATARMTATFERMWPTYWVQALAPQCPLTVLHASEPLPAEVTLGWTRVLPAGQVRTIAVPGNHVSLIEAEHLPRLGQIVSTAMAWRGPEVSRHRDEPAFALQSAHSHAPFVVCVPGAGDSVTSFVDLSSALGEACNVIGMQPRGTDGCQLPFGSVELAAQRYLDALPAITAGASPLHLIGHSFGGWVVYEMALRLHALGRPAASLTLIDTRPPNQARVPHDASRDTIVDYFLDALQLRLHAPLGIDRQTLHRLGQDALLQALHRLMVEHRLMPARSRPDSLRGSLATFAHCCRTAYIPARPYPGTLHLVLVADTRLDPEQQAAERLRLRQAWAAHAADLQPWHGPGNHMTVLAKPHSQLLAQWWTSSVRDNARPSTPHAPLPPGTTVIA
ncbi:non-ribosomal peptide synthetase, partial [Xanthomonas graminis]